MGDPPPTIMENIIERMITYYRIEKKEFSDEELEGKLNLYYATVVKKQDPDAYQYWLDSKVKMLKDSGFICPQSKKR